MRKLFRLVHRARAGKPSGTASVDEVMSRLSALSKRTPEEVMDLASGNDPEGLLDLSVEIDCRDEDLLRPWTERTRASPMPLSEAQYDAFLRGEEIPREER
jgi:hypothetical protein